MKIVILQDDFPPRSTGGAGMIAWALAVDLQKKGHQVSVIATVDKLQDEGETTFQGLKIYNLYSSYPERWRSYLSLYNPKIVKKLRKILIELRPDIVHAHNVHYHLSYQSLKISKKIGARVFLTVHDMMLFHYGKLGGFPGWPQKGCSDQLNYHLSSWQQLAKYKKRYNPLRNIIIRHYLSFVDQIVAVSNPVRQALNQNGIRHKIVVINNGIDIDEWKVGQSHVEQLRQRYRLGGKKVVLFGGRLSEAKGGRQAILALAILAKRLPEVSLLVMGKINDYAQEMISLAKEKGINDRLVFTGWICGDDLRAIYYLSDVVLVPSLYLDPFPTVNLEAMACRRPVVATCFGGSPELVLDQVTGYVVNPYQTNELADRLFLLLNDSEMAMKMGEVGFERVRREFTLEQMVERYLGYFSGQIEGNVIA